MCITKHNVKFLSSSYWLQPDLLRSFWGFCLQSEGRRTTNTTRCNKNSVWLLHCCRRLCEFQKPSSGPVWTFAHAVLGAAHAPWQIVSKSKLSFYYRSADKGLDQSLGQQITLTSSHQSCKTQGAAALLSSWAAAGNAAFCKKKKKKNKSVVFFSLVDG